jgi:hypothetical protein
VVVWVIKTFNDLRFKQKDKLKNSIARIDNFGKGYGIEVEEHLMGYDVTILKDGEVTDRTYIPSESLLRLDPAGVTEIMKKVQDFVKFTY